MKNFKHEGKVMDYVAGGTLSSGDVVALSGVGCGIVAKDAVSGDVVSLALEGVFELPSTGAIAQGARAYWNGSAVTATASSNTLMGIAMKAAASNLVHVKLIPLADSDPLNLSQAAVVTFSAGSNLSGVDGTGSNAAPLAGTETRLDSLDTAVAAILTSLKAANLMASA